MIQITPTIAIDEDELEESFVRASGPGGQNVNKVATAVELRFNVDASPNLPGEVRARLKRLAGRRMTNDGILILKADRFRSQERNRDDARTRLFRMIERASVAPKPRIKTRPTKASKERRLKDKERRGGIKRLRSGKPSLD
ncbi:MAG: alternative ribosome rescue aminoacyl-tRNA hydrolase ArfB [Hyphomicrobiaceae bacterium]